jgi:hypothetical protein
MLDVLYLILKYVNDINDWKSFSNAFPELYADRYFWFKLSLHPHFSLEITDNLKWFDVLIKTSINFNRYLYEIPRLSTTAIKILFNKGLSSTLTDKTTNNTLLHIACDVYGVSPSTVAMFLNTDINKKNKQGYTALHLACFKQNYNVVKILIEHGADVNIVTSFKKTCLDIAVKQDNKKLIRLLLLYTTKKKTPVSKKKLLF